MKNRTSWILCIMLFGLFGAQCGLEALSADVSIGASPDNPVVINSDLTLNPGSLDERVINGPWFKVSFQIKNKSGKTAYVVTNEISYSTGSKGGYSPGTSLDPSATCTDDSGGATRAYIVILADGDTYRGLNYDVNNDSIPDYISDDGTPLACDPTAYAGGDPEYWYIESLPYSRTGVYNVQMRIEGWFVDNNDVPIARLESYGYFTTQ